MFVKISLFKTLSNKFFLVVILLIGIGPLMSDADDSADDSACDNSAVTDTETFCSKSQLKTYCQESVDSTPATGSSVAVKAKSTYTELSGCKGKLTTYKTLCNKAYDRCKASCKKAIEVAKDTLSEEDTKTPKNETKIKEAKDAVEELENLLDICEKHFTSFSEIAGSILSQLTPSLSDALRIADLVTRLTMGKGEKPPDPGGGDPHAECIKKGWIWNAESISKCKKPPDPLSGDTKGDPCKDSDSCNPFDPLKPSGDLTPNGDPNGPNGPSPLNPILPPGGSGNTASSGEGSGGSNNGSGGGGSGIVAGGIASGGTGGGLSRNKDNEWEDLEDPTYKPHDQSYLSGGGGGGRRGYASSSNKRRYHLQSKLGIKVKKNKKKPLKRKASIKNLQALDSVFKRITTRFHKLCQKKIDCL